MKIFWTIFSSPLLLLYKFIYEFILIFDPTSWINLSSTLVLSRKMKSEKVSYWSEWWSSDRYPSLHRWEDTNQEQHLSIEPLNFWTFKSFLLEGQNELYPFCWTLFSWPESLLYPSFSPFPLKLLFPLSLKTWKTSPVWNNQYKTNFYLLHQSDNVLINQSRNVLRHSYNSPLKDREDYGRKGHYQDEHKRG